METATQDVEVAVNRLIEICREGQQGFQAAARAVQVPQLRAELEEYGRQRAEFCAALENALGDGGLRPTSYAAIPGVLRRGWMNLNGAIGEPVQTVLTACERGDDAARQTYSEVAVEPLPDELKGLISAQLRSIEAVHQRLCSLRDGAQIEAAHRTQGMRKAN